MDDVLIAYIGSIVTEFAIVGPQGIPWSMAKHSLTKMLLTLAAIMITMKEIVLQPYTPSPEEVLTAI